MIFTINIYTKADIPESVLEMLGAEGWTDTAIEAYLHRNHGVLLSSMQQAAINDLCETLIRIPAPE